MADLHSLCRDRVRELLDGARAATKGPWWSDEDDLMWRLHGAGQVIPGDDLFPEQVVNVQIIKAPKRSTAYAEYWPDAADDAHITTWNPSLVISVCEGWLKTLDEHHGDFPPDPDDGPGEYSWTERCSECHEETPCAPVRRIAAQLQITEED